MYETRDMGSGMDDFNSEEFMHLPTKTPRPLAPPDAAWLQAVSHPQRNLDWPPNNGAVDGTVGQKMFQEGEEVDRIGPPYGGYLSDVGTSFEKRALPPSSYMADKYVYQAKKPFQVESSQIAPWFGQPGGGTQYRLTGRDANVPLGTPGSVQNLLDSRVLKEIKRDRGTYTPFVFNDAGISENSRMPHFGEYIGE